MPNVELCYLCYDDGDNVIAVASYVAKDGETYYVCREHLKIVKSVPELEYKMLDGYTDTNEEVE